MRRLEIDTIIARLALLSPESERGKLIQALDAYLEGESIGLIERCELPRDRVRTLVDAYQTKAGRLRGLNRLLTEMGIPE